MKIPYNAPVLGVEIIEVECGIAVSDPTQFDLTIDGFGDEQEW